MYTISIPSRAERLEFLRARQRGIGSSDIAAIAGLDHFKNPLDVYLEKTRPVDESDDANIHILRGLVLEPFVAAAYAEATGRDVVEIGARQHPEREWARANVDREIRVEDVGPGSLEIKAPSKRSFDYAIEFGMNDGYVCQLQWEMACCEHSWGSFALGSLEHASGPVVHFDMERNEELIEQLLEMGDRFWHEHVLEREPPDLTEWGTTPLEVPPVDGDRVVVSDPSFIALTHELMEAYELQREAKANYELLRDAVNEYMEERGLTRVDVPGQGKLNYDWREGRTTFDHELLAAYGPLDVDKLVRSLRQEFVQTADRKLLEERIRAGDFALDLEMFQRKGDAFRWFRPYPAKDRGTP